MENNKYFEELSRILRQHDIESVPAEDGRLVILLNGQPVGRIEPGGSGEEHIRVKSGVVCKSAVPLAEIKDKFLAKLPEYMMSMPDVLPALVLFEITFDHADVVLDFEHMETIEL